MTSVVAEKSPFAMVRATISFELTAQVNFAGSPMRVAMTPAARRKYFKKNDKIYMYCSHHSKETVAHITVYNHVLDTLYCVRYLQVTFPQAPVGITISAMPSHSGLTLKQIKFDILRLYMYM